MKYIANLLVAIHIVGAAEAIVLGEKAGLDPSMLVEVLADSAATSRMLEVRGPSMATGAYATPMMKVDVFQKDLDIIAEFRQTIEMPRALVQRQRSALYRRRGARDGFARHSGGSFGSALSSRDGGKMKILTMVACVLLVGVANGQEKPALAEQAFKNVRVLKGIPVDQFMATMGFFSASLGETCTDCHSAESGGNWDKYADDNPRKNTARAHDRHDERHQQNLFRWKARDHLLLLPSRRGTSRRHSQPGGFIRAAAIQGAR